MHADVSAVDLVAADLDDVRAVVDSLSQDEARALLKEWRFWARPEQIQPDGDWSVWLILAGRGFGKTRTGAEAIRELVEVSPGARIALIGPTSSDCRDVMVEGESGLLNVFPYEQRPLYFPSKRRVVFSNGAQAFLYSSEEPARLRGPQHNFAWADEIALYDDIDAVWSNLQFGLRLGDRPRIIATTTPRPLAFLRKLLTDARTVVTRGSTFDNSANLPPTVLAEFERVYGGTTIGRQELSGELLEEAQGALWRRAMIDETRVSVAPDLVRIVVAIDPSTTAGDNSDACGLVAVGLGADGHGYVLADKSAVLPPDQWATRAVSMFDALDADRIIAEVNNGGDLVESVIRTVRRNVSYEKVHASRGKVARAEPIAALYEQKRVHHVGAFRDLEEELVNFVPGALVKSPNRADALVWGLSHLMIRTSAVKVSRVL